MITADINYALDVDGRARFDVVDLDRTNVVFDPVHVGVQDARPLNDGLDLDVNGFRLFPHRSAVAATASKPQLERDYLAEMSDFLRALTGAREVRPHRSSLILRNTERSPRLAEGFPPARFAHLDFTPRSHASFLEVSEQDDGPIAPYRRVAILQTWRAVSAPPQDSTLAVADPRSVPDSDTFVMDTALGPEVFPTCFFESRLCRVNPAHQWYYYPQLSADEVLVFKGYDSDPARCGDVMHTAFDVPGVPADAEPRRSVEARFLAFFE